MKLNKLAFSTSALAVCFFASSAAALDGGTVDIPVSLNYVGPDKCVPSVAQPTILNLTYDNLVAASNLPFSYPTVAKGQVDIALSNCKAGTMLFIEGNAYAFAQSTINGVNLGSGIASVWSFDGSAQNIVGLVLGLADDPITGSVGTYVGINGSMGATILEDNKLSLYPEAYLLGLGGDISDMSTGQFNTTARITIGLR